MIGEPSVSSEAYAEVLEEYLQVRGEEALDRAARLSQALIEGGLGPDEIVVLHLEAVAKVLDRYAYSDRERAVGDAFQFLLEVMISYGVQYGEHLELKLGERTRQAEALALLERQKAVDAERSEREKADFLAVIAHELRTPITAALGNVDLALRSMSRGKAERLPDLLQNAREALGRLSRLTSDLVEASRGDTPDLESAPHELGDLVAQACAWAGVAATEKGVTLTCDADPPRITVLGDADALLTVFGNLLSNAVRYTPAGGRVAVRRSSDAAWARVEVEDTGIGMAPDVRARIFEKFYRAPEARTVVAQGLGLGLSLANRLVLAHGGRLEVESTPGCGSTFRVLLPLTKPDQEEGPDSRAAEAG